VLDIRNHNTVLGRFLVDAVRKVFRQQLDPVRESRLVPLLLLVDQTKSELCMRVAVVRHVPDLLGEIRLIKHHKHGVIGYNQYE